MLDTQASINNVTYNKSSSATNKFSSNTLQLKKDSLGSSGEANRGAAGATAPPPPQLLAPSWEPLIG